MNISKNTMFDILSSIHLTDINRLHERIDEFGLSVAGITFDCMSMEDDVNIPFVDIWFLGYAFSRAEQKFSSDQFCLHWGSHSRAIDEPTIPRLTMSCDYHKETTDSDFVRELCNLSLTKITSTEDIVEILDIIDTVRKAKSL